MNFIPSSTLWVLQLFSIRCRNWWSFTSAVYLFHY